MKRIMRRKTEMNADLNCMSHLQMCKKKIILIVCTKTVHGISRAMTQKKTSKDFVLNCEFLSLKEDTPIIGC